MNHFLLGLGLLCFSTAAKAQSYQASIRAHQEELNQHYSSEEDSPLTEKDRKKFKGLPFFEIDSNYKVEAEIELTPESEPIEMPTTTDRMAKYKQYGLAHFVIDEDTFELAIYQNLNLINKEGYEDYLFLPFGDETNGFDSYGGGRYIDLRMTEGPSITIDFNKSYNPYCAYNGRYSCPIVPKRNILKIAIPAGIKAPQKH